MSPLKLLQIHVNDFIRQTGEKTVRWDTMRDLMHETLSDNDFIILDALLKGETVLRGGPEL